MAYLDDMATEDPVVIVGDHEATETVEARPRRSSWTLVGLAAVVLGIGLVLARDPSTPEAPPVPPPDLSAPAEPSPVGGVAVEPMPQMAYGWHRVDLPGESWQIPVVAHGPDGWMAVSQGPSSVVAHLSADATAWRSVELPGLAGGDAVAVVGKGILAVAASGLDGAPSVVASDDGGVTWAATSLPATVTALAHVDGRLIAAADPGLWVLDGTSWRSLPVGAGDTGHVTTIVAGRDGDAWALGSTDDGPAVWSVGDAAELVDISLPAGFEARSFIDVAVVGERYVALIGARGPNTSGRHFVVSDDLVTWRSGMTATSDLVDVAAPGDGSLLGRRALGGDLWSFTAGEEFLVSAMMGSPGGEDLSVAYIGSVAAARNITVVGGSSELAGVLLIRGVPPFAVGG